MAHTTFLLALTLQKLCSYQLSIEIIIKLFIFFQISIFPSRQTRRVTRVSTRKLTRVHACQARRHACTRVFTRHAVHACQ
jgi:hypothetical protein